jgi:hypothetical protein
MFILISSFVLHTFRIYILVAASCTAVAFNWAQGLRLITGRPSSPALEMEELSIFPY